MSTLLLIAGALMLSAGLVFAFRSSTSGATYALLGIVALADSGYLAGVSDRTIVFWAIAVIILCVIGYAGGFSRLSLHPTARYYIAGGAFVGMLVGFAINRAGMIVGSVIGALLGAIAWQRTPRGRDSLDGLLPILAAAGLPAVVTFNLVGLALQGLIAAR